MHNIEKYNQSISAASLQCVLYRLGETVIGRLVSTGCAIKKVTP